MKRSDRYVRRRESLAVLVAFALAFAAFAYVTVQRRHVPTTGDEPAYLLDSLSIVQDHDRDLTNQISDPQQLAWAYPVPGASAEALLQLAPHARNYTGRGLVSWHGVGMAVLLAPAVWVARATHQGLLPVRLWMAAIDAAAAAALALVLLRIGRRLGLPLWAPIATWAVTAASLMMVGYADQIYPEIPALACLAVALAVLSAPRIRARGAFVACAVAWLTPWLHFRFLLVSIPISIAALVRLCEAEPVADRTRRLVPDRDEIAALWGRLRGDPLRPLAATVGPAVVTVVGLAVTSWWWYGSPLPTASAFGDPMPTGPNEVYLTIFGGLFSSAFGLVPYVPIVLVGLAGLGLTWRVSRRWTTACLAVVVVYLAVVAATGLTTPGFSYFARYLMVFAPLLAIPAMIAVSQVRAAQVAAVVLAAGSLVLTVDWAKAPRTQLLNTGDVRLGALRPVNMIWPQMTTPPAERKDLTPVPTRYFDQDVQRHGKGHLIEVPRAPGLDPTLPSGASLPAFQVGAGKGPGLVAETPPITLPPGPTAWLVHFTLTAGPAPARTTVAKVEVLDTEGHVLVRDSVDRATLGKSGSRRIVTVLLRPKGPVVARVLTTGATDLAASRTEFVAEQLGGKPPYSPPKYPQWPKTLGWIMAALAAGWAIARWGACPPGRATQRRGRP